jgi:hypothetical protein
MAIAAYYVYDLVDPRNGQTFYVGKGKGSRRFQHVKEALRGAHNRKCDMIRSIIADGLEHEPRIISHHVCEQEALDAEANRISWFGLNNLTNIMPNGWCRPEPVRPPSDPVKTARAVVDACASRLRMAIIQTELGYRPKVGGFDATSAIDGLIAKLKEQAGEAYFDAMVGVVSRTPQCGKTLIAITARPSEAHAL